jgi:hypothetical protein
LNPASAGGDDDVEMVRIRAKIDNLTTLNATLMKGQVGECPVDRAKVLVGRGEAVLVDEALDIPGVGTVEAVKGDRTERATSRAAEAAERQTSKGGGR